jgi:hypothetical protein
VFASDTHYPLQTDDVLVERLDMEDRMLSYHAPGLGSVDADEVGDSHNFRSGKRLHDGIHGEARVGQIL